MRGMMIGALMGAAAMVVIVGPADAQSALDGPLAAPDAAPPAPRHAARPKPRKMHRAAVPTAAPDAPRAMPTDAPVSSPAPADPLSLGMKWNGNNDTAGQTRSQNLDGNAVGSGAEVGMKLHF